MKYLLLGGCAVLTGCTFLNNAEAEEIPIFGDIPSNIQEIDLTYSENAAPRISFKTTLPVRQGLPPLRPPHHEPYDLLPIIKTSRLAGSCEAQDPRRMKPWTVVIRPHGATRCEAVIAVQRATAIDVLAHDTMAIKGRSSQPVTIALTSGLDQPAVPLARVTGTFDLRLALKPVLSQLDPTHVTAIVFEGNASSETTLGLERLALERMSPTVTARPTKGFWVWDYLAAVAHPETLLQDAKRTGASRILVQMPHKDDPPTVWSAYAAMLTGAAQSGVEIFALDGFPEAIYEPGPLIEKIVRLRALLPDGHWPGIQLDIEPYLLARFSDPQDYRLYLHVIDTIKAAVGNRARVSIVMPFWFSAKTANNRPLDLEVMDRVDEVALMSYRTDVDDLQDITEHTLRYGDAVGVPVWLAVETRALPIERQATLIREPRADMANAYLDRGGRRLVLKAPPPEQKEGFRMAHQIMVRPERLTFAGQTRREVQSALNAIFGFPHPSLAGVLIHDMPGYLSLAE